MISNFEKLRGVEKKMHELVRTQGSFILSKHQNSSTNNKDENFATRRKMEALYWLKYDSARYSNLLNCVRFIKNLLKTILVGGC